MSQKLQKAKHSGYKRWVFVFLILALMVHGGVFYLFTLDLNEPPEREEQSSFIVFQPEGFPAESHELEQQAYLFDSEPIFLPTSRNYSGPIKYDASIWIIGAGSSSIIEADRSKSPTMLNMPYRSDPRR